MPESETSATERCLFLSSLGTYRFVSMLLVNSAAGIIIAIIISGWAPALLRRR